MSTTVKTTVVITAESYGEDRRIRQAIAGAQVLLDRQPKADASHLTVAEKPLRYGRSRLTLRFLTTEEL